MARGGPRTTSLKAREPASLWLARIKAFQDKYGQGEAERVKYRDMLAIPEDAAGMDIPRVPAERMVGIIAFRLLTYYQASGYDEFPELSTPRGGSGGEKFGPMIEEFLAQKLNKADATDDYRKGLADIMTDGTCIEWCGVPRFPTPLEVPMQNLTGAEAASIILNQGGYQVEPGMNHYRLAAHLRQLGSNRDQMLSTPSWYQVALFDHADRHDEEAVKEEARPYLWTEERGEFWTERSILGSGTAWSLSVTDSRLSRWMARRIDIPIDIARNIEAFDPEGRKLLEPSQLDFHDADFSQQAKTPNEDLKEDGGVFSGWHIFDQMHQRQHIIPRERTGEGGPDPFYLEVDERYPYLNLKTMRPEVEGFFPCVVTAPYRSNHGDWRDSCGIPLLRLAMDQIKAIAAFEIEGQQQVRRNVRVFGFHQEIDPLTRNKIQRGQDGVGFVMTPQMWRDDPRGCGVRILSIEGPSADLKLDRDRAWRVLSNLTGVSYSALMGEPASETVGQEKIIERSRAAQTADLIGILERSWAELGEKCRGISRLHVKSSDVLRMLGDKYVEQDPMTGQGVHLWDKWLAIDVTYNKLGARLARRFRDEDPQRAEQLMKALTLALQVPAAQIDPLPLVRELWRAFGLGEPQKLQITPEIAAALLEQLGMGQEQQAGPNGAAGQTRPPVGGGALQTRSPSPSRISEPARAPDEGKASGAIGRRLPVS